MVLVVLKNKKKHQGMGSAVGLQGKLQNYRILIGKMRPEPVLAEGVRVRHAETWVEGLPEPQ